MLIHSEDLSQFHILIIVEGIANEGKNKKWLEQRERNENQRKNISCVRINGVAS